MAPAEFESGDTRTAVGGMVPASPDSQTQDRNEFRRLSDRWRHDDRNTRMQRRIDDFLAEAEQNA